MKARHLPYLALGGLQVVLLACVTINIVRPERDEQVETNVEKTRRALAELRTFGTALESFAVDNNFYPKVQDRDIEVGPFGFAYFVRLESQLGIYHRPLSVDPWGHPYLYWSSSRHWALICTGSDGVVDSGSSVERILSSLGSERAVVTPAFKRCSEDDIVFLDGQLVQGPLDTVRRCSD